MLYLSCITTNKIDGERMIFKNKKASIEKLIAYGFRAVDGKYVYQTAISDGQFRLTVEIDGNGDIETELFDVTSEDIYTLHLVEGAVGAYVGRVRAEYEQVLRDIEQNCFETDVFKQDYTREILQYAREKYGDEAEYLWNDLPDAAVIRRKDNRKWYVLLMTVLPKRLGLDGNEPIEIVDLRFDVDELPLKIDGQRYFAGYHMNKRHWITILLDGSVPLAEILQYVDESYALAKRK